MIHAIACSPDAKSFALAGDDGTVRFWTQESNAWKLQLVGLGKALAQVASSASSKITALDNEGSIAIWKKGAKEPANRIEAHGSQGFSLDMTPDEMRLVSCSLDKTMRPGVLRQGRS